MKRTSLFVRPYSFPPEGTGETTTLFRAVGAEEYQDIMETKQFYLSEKGMQSKQFGFDAEETLKFADWDKKAVAVVEVEIPTDVLNSIGDFTPVDTEIFKSGNVTIHSDVLNIFNNSISNIIKTYKFSELDKSNSNAN